jgi:serine protease Do
MKWASRFFLIFLLVFALLTGIYFARTGVLPWFRLGGQAARPQEPPAQVDQVPLPVGPHATTVTGLPGSGSVLEALNNETVGLANKVLPSVVSITTTKVVREVRVTPRDLMSIFYGWLGGRATEDRQVKDRLVLGGFGSGVIVSADGLVVTNHHVIDGMQDVLLLLNDGRQLKANVLASDPVTDVAVLRVEAEGLVPLPLGDSDQVSVGEYVMAVGNPYGLHETVSLGNISAKGRADGTSTPDGENQAFLQTDAMINRGHSGGPLVNVKGELIGLNRAIFTDRPNEGWQGIAFAIPANTVKRSIERILKARTELDNNRWQRMGVRLKEDVPANIRNVLGLGERRGVLVEDVSENSKLYGLGGLKDNDFIVSVNGEPTTTTAELDAQVDKAAADGQLEMQVVRGKIPLAVKFLLEQPQDGEGKEADRQM